jgi:hypothetical protein
MPHFSKRLTDRAELAVRLLAKYEVGDGLERAEAAKRAAREAGVSERYLKYEVLRLPDSERVYRETAALFPGQGGERVEGPGGVAERRGAGPAEAGVGGLPRLVAERGVLEALRRFIGLRLPDGSVVQAVVSGPSGYEFKLEHGGEATVAPVGAVMARLGL